MSPEKEDVVDLESYAVQGRKPPIAERYRIRIDKTHYVVKGPKATGRELLELAGRVPVNEFKLFQKVKGKEPTSVGLDDVVDFTEPGIERFFTIPCDLREGKDGRREFTLPATDTEFLESTGWKWEAIRDGGHMWLLIYDYTVPAGYNRGTTTLGLLIPMGYPAAEIDMAYFSPGLVRRDGRAIPALADAQGAGLRWQRWSRHRKDTSRWRPGEDNVATHACLVRSWLEREIER